MVQEEEYYKIVIKIGYMDTMEVIEVFVIIMNGKQNMNQEVYKIIGYVVLVKIVLQLLIIF